MTKEQIELLKACYQEMRSRILSDMEENQAIIANELAMVISLLHALHLSAMSWHQVSENCFK